MFHSADVALLSVTEGEPNVRGWPWRMPWILTGTPPWPPLNKVAHHAHVIELSSKTGEEWTRGATRLVERARRVREGRAPWPSPPLNEAAEFEIAGIVQGSVSRPIMYRWLCGTD